jgi:hypothetical protein
MTNCPFAKLLEKEKGRWGTGLTAEDMKKWTWVQPGKQGFFFDSYN